MWWGFFLGFFLFVCGGVVGLGFFFIVFLCWLRVVCGVLFSFLLVGIF